ncbi:hypothetical protein BDQ17DRAFT_475504 [Cyathus striatus]|nr:hypothetical protein BDQ17DRAFT_475504 [Cyathus striatus]
MFSGYVKHLRLSLNPQHPPSVKRFVNDFLIALREMANLTEFSLYFNWHYKAKELPTFFASLWNIVGNNLQTLELSGFQADYNAYLPSHTHLSSLQKLVLIHDRSYLISYESEGSKIISIINGLASQLRSFEVHDNINSIAPHLPLFPALEELTLSLRFGFWRDRGQQNIPTGFSVPKHLSVNLFSSICVCTLQRRQIYPKYCWGVPYPRLSNFSHLSSGALIVFYLVRLWVRLYQLSTVI